MLAANLRLLRIKENILVSRQRDDLKKKVSVMETEKEVFMTLGGGGSVRKLNRSNGTKATDVLGEHHQPTFDAEDKENSLLI